MEDDRNSSKDFDTILESIGPEGVKEMWNLMMKSPMNSLDYMFSSVGVAKRGPVTVIKHVINRNSYVPEGSTPTTKLDSLQCPFNWEVTPMPEEELRMQEPLMSISEPAWENVSWRISAAYSLILDGEMERARGHLVRLYMILLDIVSHSDNSLRRYRPALKHVVDSMWIWFFLISHCGYLGLKVSDYSIDPDVERLVDKVTPFESFSQKQKAAIYMLHLSGGPTREPAEVLLKRALTISPNESAWHRLQGWLLQEERRTGGTGDIKAEIKALEKSVSLHRDSDNVRMLAAAYFGLRTGEGYKKADQLIKETLNKWPNNIMVLHYASTMLIFVETPLQDVPKGIEYLERAISICGENPFLHYQIGSAYFLAGRFDEAQEHLVACKSIMSGAGKMLNLIATLGHSKEGVKKKNAKQRTRRQKFI